MEENNRNTITGVRMLKQFLIALSLFSLTACLGGGGGGGGSNGGGRSINARFVDAPTQGIYYYQNGESVDAKRTDENGNFECNVGSKVTFSLRPGFEAEFGSVICGANVVFPMDLIEVGGDVEHAKYIALLLHHMDADFTGKNYDFATAKGSINVSFDLAKISQDGSLKDKGTLSAMINKIRDYKAAEEAFPLLNPSELLAKIDDNMPGSWMVERLCFPFDADGNPIPEYTGCDSSYMDSDWSLYVKNVNGSYSHFLSQDSTALDAMGTHLAQSCVEFDDNNTPMCNAIIDEI